MDAYVNSVARYLFAQSWQIALLAVIAGLISLALRNRSAHIRYLLWLIVLAKCLVPPMYSVSIAVLPQRSAIEHTRHAALPLTPIEVSVATGAGESVTIEKAPDTSQKQLTLPNAVETTILVWLTGMFLFLLWVGSRAVRYHLWLHRRRMSVPSALAQEFQELFVSFKFRKSPRIWLAGDIAQPFVWGLFRGSVYLPADFAGLDSPQHHRTVLVHELSHIARFDAAVNLLQILAQAIFWFHPFVWWVNKKIRQEREKCCDEMVVAQLSTAPEHYTNAIIEALAAERRSAHPIPSLAIVGSIKDIEERIKTMLKPGKKFHKHPSVRAIAVLLMVALLTIPVGWGLTRRARAETASEPQEEPSKSLHKAAADGDNHQIRLHVAQRADVNAKDRKGDTPLHIAVQNGRIEAANLLILKGADVNAKNRGGTAPLHIAAQKSDRKTANLLILKGADVNAKNKYGLTPVSRALLSDGGGRLMVELLVSKGAKVSALHLAAHRGDIDKVRSSLEKGTNVDVRDVAGHTPLFYAASAGQMHVVEFLISKGAEVDAKDKRGGETPLFYAGDAGWRNVVELLIARGADVNARGFGRSTALESAAWLGRGDVAELLIAEGADVNAKSDWGYIPLHAAAESGLVEIAEVLIAKGSDPDAKTEWGETPLHSAMWQGQVRIVEVLIANGADVNANNNYGLTPMRLAQKNGYTEIVELLKKHGAKE
ncbi:MAG: ankyrin repeat domain-containing protein [Planctomycetota bacterium]|jgi:cytohesin